MEGSWLTPLHVANVVGTDYTAVKPTTKVSGYTVNHAEALDDYPA